MSILVYHHDVSRLHDTGAGHPERPARIDAVLAGARRLGDVIEKEASEASRADLRLVHSAAYVETIEEFCASGGGHLDADTVASPESWHAALRAAGAGLAAIDAIRSGEGQIALLAGRPPGHHAVHDGAMGFCLFNSAAIAAERLRRDGHRVAIVDWDVHHGNGSQDSFYDSAEVLYVSLHQHRLYPGTGWVDQTGIGSGKGYTVNVPLLAGSDGAVVAQVFRRIIDPVLSEFDPDWVVISAGYDAHRSDPLAGLMLEASDYGWMAARLASLGVPVLVFLEGGYDLDALTDSVEATLLGLTGSAFEPGGEILSEDAQIMIDAAASAAVEAWDGVIVLR